MTLSIINRLRVFVRNRRKSPRRPARRQARLVFSISVLDQKTSAGSDRVVPVEGYTRDISESGLALVVPSLTLAGHDLTSENCTLRIVLLDLPEGRIELTAAPTRYERMTGPEPGHLIAVRITQMSAHDRSRLAQYLRTLP
jgi:hypothetical protein